MIARLHMINDCMHVTRYCMHIVIQLLANATRRARELCDHVLLGTEWLTQVLDGEESAAEVLYCTPVV
jgi:hypothetical protein